MKPSSPIREWREKQGITRAQLARACRVNASEISRIEEGKEGIVGELQDYLAGQGENVCEMASKQSAFIARE